MSVEITKLSDPVTDPEKAAHEALVALISSAGGDLFRTKGVSSASGANAASFLVAMHKGLTEHYRSLQK